MDLMRRKDGRRRSFAALACLLGILCVAAPGWADETPDGDDTRTQEVDEADGTDEAVDDADEDGVGEEEVAEEEVAEEEGDEDEPEASGPDPRLFVLPADSLQGEITTIVTERINQSIRERLESLGRIELLPTFEALQGEAGSDAAHTVISRAERDYTSAIGLVNAHQYEEAAEILQRAVTALRENVADLHNFGILTDAMLNLAIAYAETGYDLDARDNIRQYAQLVPDESPELEDYPEVQSLYDAEVERIQNAGTGTLNITANREGAQVYFNGEIQGETPLTLEDVSFGEHFMVVRHGDWLWSDTVRVAGRDREEDIEVELRDVEDIEEGEEELPSFYVDLRATIQTGQFGRDLQPYFEELASQTGADFIAWVLVLQEERDYAVTPFIYRVDDGMVIQGDKVLFNQELSNLRSRANDLSDTVAVSVIHMPETQAVEDVDLVPEEEEEPEPVAEEPVAADEKDDESVAMADDGETLDEVPVPGHTAAEGGIDDSSVDELPDEGSSTKKYLGWGGAAAAATGIVAGTVFLLVRGGSPAALEAEVEW